MLRVQSNPRLLPTVLTVFVAVIGPLILPVLLVGCSSEAKNSTSTSVNTTTQLQVSKPRIKETPTTVTVRLSPASDKSSSSVNGPDRAAIVDASRQTIECLKLEDKRSLSIKQTPGGGCEVLYRKTGQTTSIASAEHELSVCDRTVESVKGNLEKAGFSCVGK